MRIVTWHLLGWTARHELACLRRAQRKGLAGDLEAAAEIERLRITLYTVLDAQPCRRRRWRWAVIAV